jgi:hypothetical protein
MIATRTMSREEMERLVMNYYETFEGLQRWNFVHILVDNIPFEILKIISEKAAESSCI